MFINLQSYRLEEIFIQSEKQLEINFMSQKIFFFAVAEIVCVIVGEPERVKILWGKCVKDHIGSNSVQRGIAGDSTGHIGPIKPKDTVLLKQENQELFSEGPQH